MLLSKGDSGDDTTNPAVYYCHNVLPYKEGYESVAYVDEVPAVANETFVEKSIEFYGDEHSRLYMSWNTEGEAYVLDPAVGVWDKLPATVPATYDVNFSEESVTFGTVNGVTYIYYRGIACFVYDESAQELVEVTLVGLTYADVLGITSSYGYLIAFSDIALAWSSTIDPTDFVPSQTTGAGGGNVSDLGGTIKYAFPNNLGVLIYADTNIVAGTYTGNVQYPFRFSQVRNSKGGLAARYIAYKANNSEQFAISRAGLQSITSQAAENILPEVTNFILGDKMEDFDEVTDSFVKTVLATPMKKRVEFLASRYLVISYGETSYTHALVYDSLLQKLGRLKIDHVTCMEYASADAEIAKESIAIMQLDGAIKLVDFSPATSGTGVLIAGKFQVTHSRLWQLNAVELENVPSAGLVVKDLAAIDGSNVTNYTGYLAEANGDVKKYYFNNTAKNHSILVKGDFRLTTMLIVLNVHGDR